MNAILEKSDAELKRDVLDELMYEPSVKMTDIGVLVKNGAVTLTGFVESYGEKSNAVRAAKRVGGVNAIADDIVVKLPDLHNRTDGEVAAAAANQLQYSTTIPTGAVQVIVREGLVTLEGQVEWGYQRDAAEGAVKFLTGVTGVNNFIHVKPKLAAGDVKSAIESAFERSALLDAKKIEVVTVNNKVTLRGKVRSYAELDEAARAAWSAAGVFEVDNQLKVEWAWLST
ncbi:Osmotically-inducible protein OsmY, contains BON domain [Verrucomicrobium sp. GAS474]|uniref:BON domain-containing protein n=1 Tax=Verrucomicrobium sp. GAS474 TaxID=1882831 RepID=UPI00087CF444|nr:BON domain-containing protein [Verrucomicrobium sp. GAS474]SDU18786.1 Osmotically-inducible protein OsmY, contains BON domain [Verrucomicrobium sp. GAS474]